MNKDMTGEQVINHITKERFEFLDSADQDTFNFRVTVAQGAFFPVYHLHPSQDELFKLESGRLRLKLNGQLTEIAAGEEVLIPKGTAHQWWNIAAGESILNVKVSPAGNLAEYIKQLAYLCNTGRSNKIGLPSIPQVLVMMNKYETYKAGFPPVFLQKLGATILAPLLKLMGYKDYFPEAETNLGH